MSDEYRGKHVRVEKIKWARARERERGREGRGKSEETGPFLPGSFTRDTVNGYRVQGCTPGARFLRRIKRVEGEGGIERGRRSFDMVRQGEDSSWRKRPLCPLVQNSPLSFASPFPHYFISLVNFLDNLVPLPSGSITKSTTGTNAKNIQWKHSIVFFFVNLETFLEPHCCSTSPLKTWDFRAD